PGALGLWSGTQGTSQPAAGAGAAARVRRRARKRSGGEHGGVRGRPGRRRGPRARGRGLPGPVPPGVEQAEEALPAEAERGGGRGAVRTAGPRAARPGVPALRGLVPAGGGALPAGALPRARGGAGAHRGPPASSFGGAEGATRVSASSAPPPTGSRCRPPAAPWAPPCACTSSWASRPPPPPSASSWPPPCATLGQPAAAAGHFQRAAQLQLPQLPLAALQALGDAASCQLLARDYSGALAVFTRMQRLAREHGSHPVQPPPPPPGPQPGPGAAPALPAALLLPNAGSAAAPAALGPSRTCWSAARCLACCCCSSCKPPPAKLLPEHAHTLEKYCWEAFDSHGQESSGQLPEEELFLLLQSLVMATHEKDTEAVKSLQVEMWPLLSAEQNHLLHLVLQETVSPSGQGI
uniref:Factor VIII intron 22 protein n=1 Tax=Equus asinus TaxID=9793 RepID=A0A9L0KD20_EQUAS